MLGETQIAFFIEDMMYINKDQIDMNDKEKFVFLVFHEIGHRFILPRSTEMMVLAMTVIYATFSPWFRDEEHTWLSDHDYKQSRNYGRSARTSLGIPFPMKTLQNIFDDTTLNYYWCTSSGLNSVYPNFFVNAMLKEYTVKDSDEILSTRGLHTICNTSLAEISKGKSFDIYPIHARNRLGGIHSSYIKKIIKVYVNWVKNDNYMDNDICVTSYRDICIEITKLYESGFFRQKSMDIDVNSIRETIKQIIEEAGDIYSKTE